MKTITTTIRLQATTQRGFNCYARNSEALVVRTGLSSTVAGCLIEVVRDERNKVGTVVVSGDYSKNIDAVKVAADLLAQRARRVLAGYKIVEWVV